MKKNKQVYVLLIILFLAVVLFLYCTHRVKFLEGLPGDQSGGSDADYSILMSDITVKNKGTRGGKMTTDAPVEATGEYIPISSLNQHSVSSVVQDLEDDFDAAIPVINDNDKILARRINALNKRISEIELSAPIEDSKSTKPSTPEKNITPAQNIKKA